MPSIARAALEGGATRVTLQLRRTDDSDAVPAVELNSALSRLIADVERELGSKLRDLDRPEKQRAVRLLRERGAFNLRKSVSAVAEELGVTRFTVYNYLNREAD
ncbi:DNA-binding protein [Streptomyces sp. AA4]|nr:DNA-binding protein [Streptomyces sp. AA4]